MKNVELIQRNVVDELAWDPKVDSSHIAVTVSEDVVILNGFVNNYAEKTAAEQAAKRVKGVDGIADELEVRFTPQTARGDEAIADAAVHALRWNVSVPEDKVKVIVDRGWIKLEGEVQWYYQSEAAEESVRYLAGVKGVTNLITIKQPISAEKIKEKIESAFKRSAEIDAESVRVEVKDGTATLKGHVRSWQEKDEAMRAAWAAPGVTRVINELKIEVPVTTW